MNRKVEIRLGLDSARKCILDLGVPLLVSANSFWRSGKFSGFKTFVGRDVALDSSGFVAMKLYGGYRWSADQYAQFVAELGPRWWAQMDYCCEPEIAGSPEQVHARIQRTIEGLATCRSSAESVGVPLPMPVLQGWEPSDYVSGPIFGGELPGLIGVGSVCRRHLRGKNGLMAVIDAIDRRIPRQVTLHLFGVKGSGLRRILKEFPNRSFSADSMSYSYAARWEQWHGRASDKADALRAEAVKWLAANEPQVPDQSVFTF